MEQWAPWVHPQAPSFGAPALRSSVRSFHAELLPNKALQLTGYRSFQSTSGIFWHGTSGASLHPRRRAGS